MSAQNTMTVKNKMILSDKLWFDLASMLVGLRELSQIILNSFPGSSMVPARTYSNITENVFVSTR